MKIAITLLFSLICFLASTLQGQSHLPDLCYALNSPKEPIKLTEYLKDIPLPEGCEITHFDSVANHCGFIYTYQLKIHGKPVYNGQIKILVHSNRTVILVHIPYIYYPETMSREREGWILGNGNIVQAVDYKYGNTADTFFSDENIYIREKFSNYRDTSVTAPLFMPDPITTSEYIYGINFRDSSDLSNPFLNAQYSYLNVPVVVSGDTIFLRNTYAAIRNIGNTSQACDSFLPIPVSIPDRSNRYFEAFNALYHINNYHQYLNKIGYTNLVNYPILIDPHGQTNDQSTWSPGQIVFGDGGVDDAEDAEVIIHEYSHALLDDLSPGTNSGFSRNSLDEGTADYMASRYTMSINEYNWFNVFPWDGHNEFWTGRIINTTKHYPDDWSTTSKHKNGEIWSTALLNLSHEIGRGELDKILFSAYALSASGMTFPQMGQLLISTDSVINLGKYRYNICKVLSKYGILSGNCYNAINHAESLPLSAQFVLNYNGLPCIIISNPLHKSYNYNIYSTDGKIVIQSSLQGDEEFIYLNVKKPGIYYWVPEWGNALRIVVY